MKKEEEGKGRDFCVNRHNKNLKLLFCMIMNRFVEESYSDGVLVCKSLHKSTKYIVYFGICSYFERNHDKIKRHILQSSNSICTSTIQTKNERCHNQP